jgi:hypothetical protein
MKERNNRGKSKSKRTTIALLLPESGTPAFIHTFLEIEKRGESCALLHRPLPSHSKGSALEAAGEKQYE